MITEKSTAKTEAIFSDDREYRYLLKKEWDSKKPKATIIMTNPSISDMITTDYTTMFIINNLVKLDYGAFDILNLIPIITTKLKLSESEDIPDEIFDTNVKYIVKSAETAEKVLIAWGSLNSKIVTGIKNEVFEKLRPFEEKLYTISNEYGGKSYHPLAPQIRSVWLFNKYDLNEKTDDKQETDTAESEQTTA
jgi:hypothetical protein